MLAAGSSALVAIILGEGDSEKASDRFSFTCAFSIALFFHTYLYPQIYDFFVKGISAHYRFNRTRFKQCFDASCLLVSCVLTLTLFRKFVGIGVGTLVITLCNGFLIGKFSDLFDKFLAVEPLFPRFAAHFDLEG